MLGSFGGFGTGTGGSAFGQGRSMRDLRNTLILFILVRHTSKLNYRIIVNTVQRDSVCKYLLPLPSSVGIRSTCSETTITKFVIHT
jgi:hypothetical protein